MNSEQRPDAGKLLMITAALMLLIWAAQAVSSHRSGRIESNEFGAATMMSAIQSSQEKHFKIRGSYGNFDELRESGVMNVVSAKDSSMLLDGYLFTLKVTPKMDSRPPSYTVNGDPQPGNWLFPNGRRHFYLDSNTNILRVNSERPATADDDPEE